MKKLLFFWVISFMMILKGYAQPSVAAPTPPARSAGNVVSLFSDAYTNVSGSNFFPNWGQGTIVSDVTIAGNATKLYSNLDFQGLQLSGSLDVSSMENLHLDIWTTDVTTLNVFLINTSPATVQQGYAVTPTSGAWYSIDIALSNYNTIALNNIGQLMFTGSGNFYMDNLYFWKSANSPSLSNFNMPAKVLGDAPFTITPPTSNSTGSFSYSSSNTSVATVSGNTITIVGAGSSNITATQAATASYGSGSISSSLVVAFPPPSTAAPTPPSRNADNVVSMFSGAYTNVTVDTWSTGWDNSSVTDITVAGNATKQYNGGTFVGVECTSSPLNLVNMEKVHFDIWTPDVNVFKIKLVDFGADGSYGGGDDVEFEIGYNTTHNSWLSYDINLSDFTGLVTRGHVAQFIFTIEGGSTFYLDNLYFWRALPSPTFGAFSVPSKTIGAAPFTLTAPTSNSTGTFSYTSSNTNVATISGSTVTIIGAGTSVITATQAAAGSYGPGNTTANLVVTGPSTPQTAAPNPPVRAASDVKSLFSDAYTNIAGTNWFPWWGQNAIAEDTIIAGNLARKYPNLNYHGVELAGSVDASTMSKLHFDLWTANCNAFNFFLIQPGGIERKVTVTPALSGWNSYDINLSEYSSQGINLANIFQFKFESDPFGGPTVYLDNIYFWKPAGSPSYGTFSVPAKTVGDAKFKITPPTSTSPVAFTYTSSNTSVATISNDSIIIVGAGNSTITANQAAGSGFLAGSISTVFTVNYAPPANAAPIPPTRNVADVISLYSDVYNNVPVNTWSTDWDNTNLADVQIGGNNNKKYTNLVFAGIEFTSSPVDASAMTTYHIDYWTPDATVFKIKLVDFGANGIYGGGDDSEDELTFTPATSGWVSYDIPLSSFSGLASRAHLAQMIFVASNSTVYIDNVYFWKGTATSPSVSVVQPTCTLSTGSISVVTPSPIPSGMTFSKDNGVSFTSTNGIFTGLTAGTYKIRSKTSLGVISDSIVAAIISTTPLAPGTITGNTNVSQCDTLQTYSVANTDGYTYSWAVTGTGNYVKSGQGTNSVVMVMKVAGSVSAKAAKCTTYGAASTLTVTSAMPATPSTITSTGTNICLFTQSYVATSNVKDTIRIKKTAGVTGYYFDAPAGSTVVRLNDTTITVVFADTMTLTSPKYINAYNLSLCDTSLAKSITLTRALPATPASITITPVSIGTCGEKIYDYTAPALPTGATGYLWNFSGPLYSTASIVSGSLTSQTIRIKYTNNAAAGTTDSVKLYYNSGCGYTAYKGAKLTNTLLGAPAVPSTLTGTVTISNQCGNRQLRFTTTPTPVATATAVAATGYEWDLAYSARNGFGAGILDSAATVGGASASSAIKVHYANNGISNDSIRVRYTSGCGTSAWKYLKIALATALTTPTPASITATSLPLEAPCGKSEYRFSTPVAPSTAPVGTGYLWQFFGTNAAAYSFDSVGNTLTSQVIKVRFNASTAAANDSIYVYYTSGCGTSAKKAAKLSYVSSTNVPAVPASITIAGPVSDVCGARTYRYTAPALPAGSATASPATGYAWSLPNATLVGTLDSPSNNINSKVILVKYASNAAAVTGDSIRLAYTSACGNSKIKAVKLTNTAKVCFTSGTGVISKTNGTIYTNDAQVYPNPNNGSFNINIETGVKSNNPVNIDIVDMFGKVVAHYTAVNNFGKINKTISQNTLPNGVYTVKYTVGSTTNSIRMVVQK
jgi:hypothetical protein